MKYTLTLLGVVWVVVGTYLFLRIYKNKKAATKFKKEMENML